MQFCYGYNMSMNYLGLPEGRSSLPPIVIVNDPTSGCGARGIRTPDILLAKQALYQLSYGPDKHD